MNSTCETARDESRRFLISKNLVHAEEEQVMEIGVVSRKKGKLTFAKANYSQLRPAGLERKKSREKYLMLEQNLVILK